MNAKELLSTRFGELKTSTFRDNVRYIVPVEQFIDVMTALKNEGGFDYLVDVTGIDYLHYPDATDRYGVVYSLANTENSERVYVKVFVNDPDPRIPTVYGLWKGCDWMEREVYGVHFDGYPDLRRILMPDEFAAFPLRKDYPLRGRGERHNFETITRAES
jgi:NADH-quinone oxidoreductase subunit C